MSDQDSTPSALERYTAIGAGVPLLLIAMSMLGWGVRLVAAGLREAAWPPGLEKLLLPIVITAAVVGFGGWRLLLLGVPARIGGQSLGRLILTGFGAAAVLGALL
ncbi:MAG TPA: hypothetical protein VF801_17310 [Rhodocyclaceae bacterium]